MTTAETVVARTEADRPVKQDRRTPEERLGLATIGGLGAVGLGLMMVAQAQGAQAWVLVAFLVAALAAVGVYWTVVQRTVGGLRRRLASDEVERRRSEDLLVAALEQVRGGDLVRANQAAGELSGRIARSFAAASGALGVLAQRIQGSSVEIASAANSVNQLAAELASGSSQQAASVVEITAAMEELARTASQIADNASQQARLAEAAEASGNVGAAAVEQAVDGVEEVKKRISGIASRADTLGTRSKEIYRVLDLITEIAQETHILSLNAAIEAAAAGAHGRRFSVVAEEVRRLAQRSQESVESVRNLLDEFASSIRATVVATEEGSKEAARVLERGRAAAAAIEELRSASSDTARVAREISLATQEQNAASDEVVLTLKEVSQVVQRMADGLKQFSQTADRLNDLGLTIQLLAQSFHLDSPHSLKNWSQRWSVEAERRFGNWESVEALLQQVIAEMPYVELAYVVDGEGRQLAYSLNRDLTGDEADLPASLRAGEGITERPWYRAVSRERRTVITPVYESLLTEQRCFTVAAPIAREYGRILGVLGLDINVGSWTRI
ncbi:MAG TPA: methyl-accepting chemotaxis protein [Thermoanaerobaculia bacterium]|nr:methyl-accepting chemotaxis protein [Thermoanaerobaculia bacterium]